MDSKDVLRRLLSEGWEVTRIAGSHHVLRHPDRPTIVVLPHPRRDIPIGTLRSIFRHAGWKWPPRS